MVLPFPFGHDEQRRPADAFRLGIGEIEFARTLPRVGERDANDRDLSLADLRTRRVRDANRLTCRSAPPLAARNARATSGLQIRRVLRALPGLVVDYRYEQRLSAAEMRGLAGAAGDFRHPRAGYLQDATVAR